MNNDSLLLYTLASLTLFGITIAGTRYAILCIARGIVRLAKPYWRNSLAPFGKAMMQRRIGFQFPGLFIGAHIVRQSKPWERFQWRMARIAEKRQAFAAETDAIREERLAA